MCFQMHAVSKVLSSRSASSVPRELRSVAVAAPGKLCEHQLGLSLQRGSSRAKRGPSEVWAFECGEDLG